MSTQSSPWEVPEPWKWVQLGDVAEIVGGGTPPTNDPDNFSGTIPWITPADLSGYTGKFIEKGSRNITEDGLRNSAARLLPPGTVLFSSRAPIGYVAIARNVVATNQGFKSFILPEDLDSEYVYYYMQRARQLARDLASGTTFPEISARQSAKIPFPVAPLAQQRRIVEAIESHLTRLDDAVATLERVQRNLKRYRASVLKAAVEGRLVPTEAELARTEGRDYEPASVLLERILAERQQRSPSRYAEPIAPEISGLSELPEGWCWASIDQLAAVGTGATPKRGEARFWSGGTIPWITSAVVNQPVADRASELVTQAALAETNLSLYPAGTVLVAMYGEGKTRGRASVLGIEATTNQALAALEFFDTSAGFRNWILAFFEHNYFELRRVASGGVQPNLNLGLIRQICVPVPPVAEQFRIVQELQRTQSVEAVLSSSAAVQQQRIVRLRQSILKWAFEGRLVDQDPNDEPASILLERIKAERAASAGTAKSRKPRRKGNSTNP